MTNEASPRPWRVNGHSIEANDPDGLWLQNEKTGWWVVANLPSCPKSRMSKKNRETWDAVVEANAALIVDAVNNIEEERNSAENCCESLRACLKTNARLEAERDRLRAELDALQTSYNEIHSELADKTRNYEDVIACHEHAEKSLRDLVGRFAKYAVTYHHLGVQGKQLVAEARAAIGAGETPTGKGVGV